MTLGRRPAAACHLKSLSHSPRLRADRGSVGSRPRQTFSPQDNGAPYPRHLRTEPWIGRFLHLRRLPAGGVGGSRSSYEPASKGVVGVPSQQSTPLWTAPTTPGGGHLLPCVEFTRPSIMQRPLFGAKCHGSIPASWRVHAFDRPAGRSERPHSRHFTAETKPFWQRFLLQLAAPIRSVIT